MDRAPAVPVALARPAPPMAARPASGRLDEEPYRSLDALVRAIETMAEAAVRHDARALETATSAAAELVARVERLAADGIDSSTSVWDEVVGEDLVTRLQASARLAAQVIERAWTSEAASLHLLARCLGGDRASDRAYAPGGRVGRPEGGAAIGNPLVVERRA